MEVFPDIRVSNIKFDLWTQNLCYKCALINGRQLFCSFSGRVRLAHQFCYNTDKNLEEFREKYKHITVFPEFTDGLIDVHSHKTVLIKYMMKLLLNRVNKQDYLCDKRDMKEPFRQLFQRLLDSNQGDYLGFESLQRIKFAEDKEIEAQARSQQTAIKNSNLRYCKSLDTLAEALKITLDQLFVANNQEDFKKLFEVQDYQDLVGNIIPNYITYFIKYKLEDVLRHEEVVLYLQDLINGSVQQQQLLTDALRDQVEAQAAEFIRNNLRTGDTVTLGNFNGSHTDKPVEGDLGLPLENLASLFETLRDKPVKLQADSGKTLVCSVMDALVKRRGSNGKESGESHEVKSLNSPGDRGEDSSDHGDEESQMNASEKSDHSPNKSPNQEEPKQQLQLDPCHSLQSVSKQLVFKFVGAEILKAELLRGIWDYHRKRQHDKKVKRDLIRQALEQLAAEVTTLIDAEVQQARLEHPATQDLDRRCVLCDGLDHHKICGRLIHLKKHEWIHVNCALWSEGVSEVANCPDALQNVYQVIKKAKTSTCPECGKTGASMTGHSDGNKRLHLLCAVKQKCIFTVNISRERKISSLDSWLKNSMTNYQKHYKHSSILFFVFCISMEMVTCFKVSRRLFIQKKHAKGVVVTEPVKSDAIVDLSTSIRELNLKKKFEADAEGKNARMLMSRIGNLLFLSIQDTASDEQAHKIVQAAAKVRQQYLLGLRKEELRLAEQYYDSEKELLFLMLRRLVVARLDPVASVDPDEPLQLFFDVFELDVDLTRPQHIFELTKKRLTKQAFEAQLARIFEEKRPDFEFEGETQVISSQQQVFDCLYNKLCFNNSEVRSYLASFLKASLDKFKQNQLTTKNYLHYQHIMYQGSEKQQILLDVCEKSSIYARMGLLFEVARELEKSPEFVQDLSFTQDKQKFSSRSRVNPKARSFSSCSTFTLKKRDAEGFRLSEKILNELARPNAQATSEALLAVQRDFKPKAAISSKANERGFAASKKDPGAYKSQNTFVAPSKIHKYGSLV